MNILVMLQQLGEGMIVSVEIFLLTLLFSLPLGLLVAFGRMSKNRVVRSVAKVYISIMRGTPLMLQLLVVYFAPSLVFKLQIGPGYRFVAVILAFSINYAAYFAEIYRSGIESMPIGQYEAAQVIKRILPSVTNEIITLVKDTSLAFAIAQAEMFTIAKQIAARETSMVPLMVAGIFYYVFNLVVAVVMEKVEKAYAYYR